MVKLLLITLSMTLSTFAFSADLTVVGKDNVRYTVTLAQIESLPVESMTTDLPWATSASKFEGVSLQDIIAFLGLSAQDNVTFVALNNYQITIPFSDFERFSPIIAFKNNGQYMSIRSKGPYWLVYPLSRYPELDNTDYHAKMIWQLKEIHL